MNAPVVSLPRMVPGRLSLSQLLCKIGSAGTGVPDTGLVLQCGQNQLGDQGPTAMPEQAEGKIVRNLVEALERLHEDLDRVELWTAALHSFQRPVPEYKPGEHYLLGAQRPEQKRARF